MQPPYPFPNLDPLVRLYPKESLRINTERWTLAHTYHRQRQNIVHQSLWQPGIVYGLGVKVISPPESTHSQFRDRRWIEIQPGLAIDIYGNPIVVDAQEDRTYRIAASTPLSGDRTIHIYLQYVDPDYLEIDVDSDRVVERFRFDQSSQPPTVQDIELCRIKIGSGEIQLETPADPLAPGVNELDLCYRPQARLRPQHWLHLCCPKALSYQSQTSLQQLLNALPSLHPSYGGQIKLCNTIHAEELKTATLLYISDTWLQDQLDNAALKFDQVLIDYLGTGGTILIESEAPYTLKQLPQQLGRRDQEMETLVSNHILRQTPFLFGQSLNLDSLNSQAVEILSCDRIVAISRNLVLAWQGMTGDRTITRTAHELGINLLHFASYYRLLHNLMQ